MKVDKLFKKEIIKIKTERCKNKKLGIAFKVVPCFNFYSNFSIKNQSLEGLVFVFVYLSLFFNQEIQFLDKTNLRYIDLNKAVIKVFYSIF